MPEVFLDASVGRHAGCEFDEAMKTTDFRLVTKRRPRIPDNMRITNCCRERRSFARLPLARHVLATQTLQYPMVPTKRARCSKSCRTIHKKRRRLRILHSLASLIASGPCKYRQTRVVSAVIRATHAIHVKSALCFDRFVFVCHCERRTPALTIPLSPLRHDPREAGVVRDPVSHQSGKWLSANCW